jgi:hypothetical protein
MKIEIRYVKIEDKGRIKKALKKKFEQAPAVTILETRADKYRGAIPVTISNGPRDAENRKKVGDSVDVILMQHDYKLCSITHSGTVSHKAEKVLPAWNIED